MLTVASIVSDLLILVLAVAVQHYRFKAIVKEFALDDAVQDIIDLEAELEELKNA